MKKKTEIAVKITDKNREKVRGILDMFGEVYGRYIFSYEDICYEPECEKWGGGVLYKNQITYVKPKELRNILAVEHLKGGDVIIASIGGSARYIVEVKSISDSSHYSLIIAEKYKTIHSDGEISDTIMEGGCFTNFLRYATEEEKALLEPKKELEIGKWYKCKGESKFLAIHLLKNRYGFDCDGEWFSEYSDYVLVYHKDYTEATPQEVEKALIEEAKRRGYKEGVKFKSLIYDKEDAFLSSSKLDWEEVYDNGWHLRDSDGFSIFHNGKWAGVIKNDDKPQAGDVCKFWDDDESKFVIDRLTSIDSTSHPYNAKCRLSSINAKKLTEQEVIYLLFKK